MQQEAIQHWLRRKTAAETATGALFIAGCLVLGSIVLVITYFFTYAIVWFGFNFGVSSVSQLFFSRRLRLPHGGIVAASLAFIALLFWANQRISREYLSDYPRRNYPGSMAGMTDLVGSLIVLLAYPGASARMIIDVLLTGPRLVMAAWDNAGKSGRLARMDVEACSRVLAILLQKAGRVSFAELTITAPLANPESTFRQLRDLPGVVFLREEPIGLSLTQELREELVRLSGQASQSLSAGSVESNAFNLPPGTIQELLGVSASASLEEIEAAYENWIWQSRHRAAVRSGVSEMDGKSEQQFKAVKAAYETFLAKHKSDPVVGEATRVDKIWERSRQSGQE